MKLPANLKQWAIILSIGAAVCALLLALGVVLNQSMSLPLKGDGLTINLKQGESISTLASNLAQNGLKAAALRTKIVYYSNVLLAKIQGKNYTLKHGEYTWKAPVNLFEILQSIHEGRVVYYRVTLVEGKQTQEIVQTINSLPKLKPLPKAGLKKLAKEFAWPDSNMEGAFFADTYLYKKGDSAESILHRAHQLLFDRLKRLWNNRDTKLPYKTPYQALIMASIIEAETANDKERPMVASVFINRLRKGMRLQTDPTVVYGIRDHFRGRLHRSDLRFDTPYNTYTRHGLPPTPIGNIGDLALQAAFHPAKTPYLFFVSKNNGTHYFSKTLKEHNKAVHQYQLSGSH